MRDPYYSEPRRIDYARMQAVFPKQKAALTRAEKRSDPLDRLRATIEACEKTVPVWDEIGAWPDDWARWARALEDAWRAAWRELSYTEREDALEEYAPRVEALVSEGLR